MHPFVCAISDMGSSGDLEYLVMPYYAGGSLADLLARNAHPRLSTIAASTGSAGGVRTGLRPVRGVVHRDIKPDNICLMKIGNAVLTDFGIATARFQNGRLTVTGRAMGTPPTCPPNRHGQTR